MSGYVAGRRSLHDEDLRASLARDQAEVLRKLRKDALSTDDLVMVCHMGRAAVQRHLRSLLWVGKIEREKVTRIHRGRSYEVETGRYKAVQI